MLDFNRNFYIKQLLLFEKMTRQPWKKQKIDVSVSILFSFVFALSLVYSMIMVGLLF